MKSLDALSTPTRSLAALGQSLWLDTIGRRLIVGGTLRRLIDEDRLTGVTTNPAIFAHAIASGDDLRRHHGRARGA